MTTPAIDPRIERLATACALTTHMLQLGCSLSLLQQQLTIVRSAAQDVLDIDDMPYSTHLHVQTPIPESVADQLAEDVVVPDDVRDAED